MVVKVLTKVRCPSAGENSNLERIILTGYPAWRLMSKLTSYWQDVATTRHVYVLASWQRTDLRLCICTCIQSSLLPLFFSFYSVPSASHFAPTDRRARTLAHRVKRPTAMILQNQNTCSWNELLRSQGGKLTCLRRSETRC